MADDAMQAIIEEMMGAASSPRPYKYSNPYTPELDQRAYETKLWQLLGVDPYDYANYGTDLDPAVAYEKANPKPTKSAEADWSQFQPYERQRYGGSDPTSKLAQYMFQGIDAGNSAADLVAGLDANAAQLQSSYQGADLDEVKKAILAYDKARFDYAKSAGTASEKDYQAALKDWQKGYDDAVQQAGVGGLWKGGGPGENGLPAGNPFDPNGPSWADQGFTIDQLLSGGRDTPLDTRQFAPSGFKDRMLPYVDPSGAGLAPRRDPAAMEQARQADSYAGRSESAFYGGPVSKAGSSQVGKLLSKRVADSGGSRRWQSEATVRKVGETPIYNPERMSRSQFLTDNGRGATLAILQRAMNRPQVNPAYEALLARMRAARGG